MNKPIPTHRSEFWCDVALAVFIGLIGAMVLADWWFA